MFSPRLMTNLIPEVSSYTSPVRLNISPNFSLLSAVVGCGVWPCAPEAHSPMVAAAAARRHTLAQLKLYQYLRNEAGALLAVFAVGIALLAVCLVDMDELHAVGLTSRRGAAIQVGAHVRQAARTVLSPPFPSRA